MTEKIDDLIYQETLTELAKGDPLSGDTPTDRLLVENTRKYNAARASLHALGLSDRAKVSSNGNATG